MDARPAKLCVGMCLLATLSACSTLPSPVQRALGIGGKEATEAQRLARAERAATLSDDQINRRIAFLTDRLDERRLHAAAWWYGWLVIDGGGMVARAWQSVYHYGTHRVSDISQAGKGAIGVAYLLLNPMPGVSGANPVRDMSSATREDKLAQLAEAEYILSRTAERAESRKSWLLHFGNLFLNAAAAAPVAAYGNWNRAAQGFFIGTAAGEAQIWTQPWNGPSDWADYERFVATDGAETRAPQSNWRIVPTGTGLAVLGRF